MRHRKRWGWKEGVKKSRGGTKRPGKAHHDGQCLMPVTSPNPSNVADEKRKPSSSGSDSFILSLKPLFEMRVREIAWMKEIC